jgi:hypothetical protein
LPPVRRAPPRPKPEQEAKVEDDVQIAELLRVLDETRPPPDGGTDKPDEPKG